MMPPPPRPRWRLRLTVRSLIGLVVVVGVLLGWLVHRANVQRDAVRAIKAAGGSVTYDFEVASGRGSSGEKSPGPKWLVDLLGVDFLSNVIRVSIREPQTDDVLVHIGRLRRLEVLLAVNTSVTDAGLANFAGLSDLHILACQGSPQLTDAGLAHLAGLQQLGFLSINGRSGVRGFGLSHLAGLAQLTNLQIHTENDAGLSYLRRHKNLDFLLLSTGEVTDATLAELAQLTWLKGLSLVGEAGSDTGVHRLESLSNLRSFQVSGPWFTDAGLASIEKMETLSRLNVSDVTSVTPAGLERLKKRRRTTLSIGVVESGLVDRARADRLRRVVEPNRTIQPGSQSGFTPPHPSRSAR